MMTQKLLSPKNDLAFKRLFGNEKNQHLLLSFLNSTLMNQLEAPLKEVSFLKRVQEPETASKRQSVVDVLCQDERGVQYVIEMQVASSTGFKKRAVVYASRAYLSQIKKGAKYEHLKEVIFLALCDFNIFPKKQHYKSEHQLLDKKNYEQDLSAFSFTFVNLPKFEQSVQAKGVPLNKMSLEEKWYYFLRKGEEISLSEADNLADNDAIIKEAFYEIDAVNWNDEALRGYESVVKAEMDEQAMRDYREQLGMKQGLKQGKAEGRQEAIAEIVLELLNIGMSKQRIHKITGLSIEEIERYLA